MKNIHIVTPLRDEVENIPRLLEALSSSTKNLQTWVIVENNSNDGSKELLSTLEKPGNVENLIILHKDNISSDYALGAKYSAVVNEGFKYIESNHVLDDDDCIGIVDADSFPEPTYFEKLVEAFQGDERLGITSGVSIVLDKNKQSIHSSSWVLGSCRLWRYKCFNEAGYMVAPSADTVSVALAALKGWSAYPTKSAIFYSREVGKRVSYAYYGRSSYFRGNTPFYALARAAKLLLNLQVKDAMNFSAGYFSSFFRDDPQIDNQEVYAYFRMTVPRKLERLLWPRRL